MESFINQQINVNKAIYNKKYKPMVPGQTPYNRIVENSGKNTVILGDSMINNIKRKRFNNLIKGDAKIYPFRGATVKVAYSPPYG